MPLAARFRLAIPPFREGQHGAWTLRRDRRPRPIFGYFSGPGVVLDTWILSRNGQIWMATTPQELESQYFPVQAARGHTLIGGLGLGIALFNIARKPEVSRVTVVERDAEVLELFAALAAPTTWEGWEKVALVHADAKTYAPDTPVDLLYVDIWPLLAAREALADTQTIQRRVQAARVAWWGQELDFIAWCAARGLAPPPTLEDSRAFAAWTGLPLIETDNPEYPLLAYRAAQHSLLSHRIL